MYTLKQAANKVVTRGVRLGEIWKSDTCEKCERSGIKLHGHHFDYDKPFDVVWLCVRCHGRVHELLDKASKPAKARQLSEEKVSTCAIVFVKCERISLMTGKRYVLSGWKCKCQVDGI